MLYQRVELKASRKKKNEEVENMEQKQTIGAHDKDVFKLPFSIGQSPRITEGQNKF